MVDDGEQERGSLAPTAGPPPTNGQGPRTPRVTSHDVARAAGVSQATVSRVLQGSTRVKPATRDRVFAALSETGYHPDAIARAMVTRTTDTIGVVVEDITNPFYPELLEALATPIAIAGRRMILWTSGAAGEPSAIDAIRQRMVDGVIFASATRDSPALEAVLTDHAPFVLVNRYVEGVQCDTVTTDNAAGGSTVAEHLSAFGHRRVGLIGSSHTLSTAIEREEGFRAWLARAGTPLDDDLVIAGAPSFALGRDGLQELLHRRHPPTAIFCVNDITALGALSAAAGAAVPVPGILSIVGFDDIDMAAWETFSLTTMSQPVDQMAEHAVRLLLDRIDRPKRAPEHVTISPVLVRRATTGVAPTE